MREFRPRAPGISSDALFVSGDLRAASHGPESGETGSACAVSLFSGSGEGAGRGTEAAPEASCAGPALSWPRSQAFCRSSVGVLF